MNERSVKEMLKDADPYVRRDACESAEESRGTEYIQDLAAVLEDEDLSVREAALNALISIGGTPVAEAILPILRSEDVAIRNMGIEILEHLGRDAVGPVLSILKDTDDDVVKFGVDILSKIEDERVEKALATLIEHKNPNVRAAVALCLGKTKAPAAVPTLLKALGDSEEWVRFSAIEGLGQLEDKSALDALLNIIEKDSGLVQEAALDAVARIASTDDSVRVLPKVEALLGQGHVLSVSAVLELMEKALMPGSSFSPSESSKEVFFNFFSDALESEDRSVQDNGLRGLGLLKLPKALVKVFAFTNTLPDIDEDTEAVLVATVASIAAVHGPLPGSLVEELKKGGRNQNVIVRAIGEIRSTDAIPLLEDLIQAADKEESRVIVSALEAIGSSDSTAVLGKLLKHSDGHTRGTAARALAALGGADAVEPIFEALNAECYKNEMEEMADVLALIPSEAVSEGFCRLISSPNESLREMGARGLGMVGHVGTLSFLKEAAADSSIGVRKASYRSMAMLGITEATGDVLKGLEDVDDDVKLSVLKSLSGWSGPGVREALTRALKDANVWVRYHAVVLLGDLSGDGTENLIIGLLENDEPPVKAAAAGALGKIGTEKSVQALERFIDHDDPNVRSAVEKAMETLTC
jgi:HEAT repeat protein